jgi:hypothetical protein
MSRFNGLQAWKVGAELDFFEIAKPESGIAIEKLLLLLAGCLLVKVHCIMSRSVFLRMLLCSFAELRRDIVGAP